MFRNSLSVRREIRSTHLSVQAVSIDTLVFDVTGRKCVIELAEITCQIQFINPFTRQLLTSSFLTDWYSGHGGLTRAANNKLTGRTYRVGKADILPANKPCCQAPINPTFKPEICDFLHLGIPQRTQLKEMGTQLYNYGTTFLFK